MDLRASEDATTFEFSALVDFELTKALYKLVAAHPEIKRLTLESHGSYISEAHGVVTVLRARRSPLMSKVIAHRPAR